MKKILVLTFLFLMQENAFAVGQQQTFIPNLPPQETALYKQINTKSFARRVGETALTNVGQGLVSVGQVPVKMVINPVREVIKTGKKVRHALKEKRYADAGNTLLTSPYQMGKSIVKPLYELGKEGAHKVYRVAKSASYIGKSKDVAIDKIIDAEVKKLESDALEKQIDAERGQASAGKRYDIQKKGLKTIKISERDEATQGNYYKKMEEYIRKLNPKLKEIFKEEIKQSAKKALQDTHTDTDTKTIVLDRALVKNVIKEAFDHVKKSFDKNEQGIVKIDGKYQRIENSEPLKKRIDALWEESLKQENIKVKELENFLIKTANDFSKNNRESFSEDAFEEHMKEQVKKVWGGYLSEVTIWGVKTLIWKGLKNPPEVPFKNPSYQSTYSNYQSPWTSRFSQQSSEPFSLRTIDLSKKPQELKKSESVPSLEEDVFFDAE